jgi:hypothetical protein
MREVCDSCCSHVCAAAVCRLLLWCLGFGDALFAAVEQRQRRCFAVANVFATAFGYTAPAHCYFETLKLHFENYNLQALQALIPQTASSCRGSGGFGS